MPHQDLGELNAVLSVAAGTIDVTSDACRIGGHRKSFPVSSLSIRAELFEVSRRRARKTRLLEEPMTITERMHALRVIDANANRATEALRVLEDYGRFVRSDRQLSESLKQVRHDLTTALDIVPADERLRARDTLRDVGTDVQTQSEYERHDLGQVAAANWKRAEQALRSLEEFTKPWWNDASAMIEQLRYRLYSLEKRALSASKESRIEQARLYVLCSGLSDECEFARRIEALTKADVDVLQLRDKELSDRELLSRAKILRTLTAGTKTLFIVNDRADIACLTDADGVHVGQDELAIQDARIIMGPEKLVGMSTHSLQQAIQAERDGADYIGCGPVFASATKEFDELAGEQLLREVEDTVHIPAFAIGGITLENLRHVLESGFKRVAVQNAIWNAEDCGKAAKQFRMHVARTTCPGPEENG